METIIKYKYNQNDHNFTSYLTDETLGDLQENLLQKENLSLINIKYIICNFTINNEEYTECIGQLPFSTKLLDFLLLKENPVFNLINNDTYVLNNYHYTYLNYIRYRNLNDYDNQLRNNYTTTTDFVYYFYTNPNSLLSNTTNIENNTPTFSPLYNNVNDNSYENIVNIINDYNEDVKIVLTDEEINSLNYGKYSQLKINEDEYKCPITLKKLEDDDDVVKLPCNHIFCKNELLEWVSNDSNKCPMCRATIANGRAVI